MGKKKLNTLLLVALFTFALNFFIIGSHSFAMTTTEAINQCRADLQILTNKGMLQIENVNSVNLGFFNDYGKSKGYIIIIGKIGNSESKLYISNIVSDGNIGNARGDSNQWAQTTYDTWLSNSRRFSLNGTSNGDGAFSYNNLIEPFYVYNNSSYTINTRVLRLGAYEEYGGSYIISRFSIEMLTNNIINNYKGKSYVYSYYYTYNNNNWLLGEISGYEELSEVIIKLIHTESDRVIKTWYLSDIVDGKFSCNGSLIYRNDLYYLDYETWQNGIVNDIGRFNLTFMPPGTIITDGQITTIGSGDNYNVQNSTNDIIGFLSNTNIPSGDEPTLNDLPSIEVEDSTASFFDWLYNNVIDVFTDNTNTNLEIPIYNEVYTIPSNIFVMNIQPFTTFIQAAWWFIIGVPFIKYIRTSIEHLKGGKIPASDDKSDLLGNVL